MSPVPSGTQIRRVTRDASRYHSGEGLSALFENVYTGLLAVAIAGSMIFSLSSQLAPDDGPVRAEARSGPGLEAGWLAVLPAIAAVAVFIGLVTRLGPLALSAPESSWWLPMPVDRRSLLRPAALRWPLFGLVVGTMSGLTVAFAMPDDALSMIGAAVFGAALTVTLVIVAGLVQPRPEASRALRMSADAVATAVPIAGVLLAVLGTSPPRPGLFTLPIAVILVGAAVALARRWDDRLGDVTAAGLRHHGAVTDEALVAVLSLDTRGLGRALSVRTEPAQRLGSSRMSWLTRVPKHLRPQAALISSDALLFARTPRQPAQVILALGLPGLGLLVPNPGPVSTIALLLVGAYIAALATGEGARRAQLSPGLDAALPISQRYARLSRMALPAVVLCLWFVIVTGVLGWRYDNPAEWILLGLLTGPAWAAAAVRAAYRPVATFAGPVAYTPMGSLPPGLSGSMMQGPDVALIGSVPLVVAIVLGTTHPNLLLLQVPLSAIAVLIALYQPARPEPPARPKPEREEPE